MPKPMVTIQRTGEWQRFRDVFSYLNISGLKEKFDKELQRQAEMLADQVRAVYSGRRRVPGVSHKRLHPWTAALKGSSKLFEDNGYLANSVEVVKNGFADYSVQINPSAKTDNQWEYWKVAKVLENGTEISVTPAMRGYLHSQGIHLKKKTQVLVLPARPVWKPLYKIFLKRLPKEFENMIRDLLRD